MTTITTATPTAVLPKRTAFISQIEAAGFNPRTWNNTRTTDNPLSSQARKLGLSPSEPEAAGFNPRIKKDTTPWGSRP
jgi:hypothetical protein